MMVSCSKRKGLNASYEKHQGRLPGITGEITSAPLVSIIILIHNQLYYTKRCIESIVDCTPEHYQLILVDNGSDEETQIYLQREVSQRVPQGRLKLIRNDENLGYSKGNNQGLSVADAPYLMLLNNDVVVTPGWLTGLINCAERIPRAGIVGPMTNRASGPQVLTSVTYDTVKLDDLHGFAKQRTLDFKGEAHPFWRIVGFCMLIKREVIQRIGGLDERYGLGNFEDDDFNLRSAIAGYESWFALDVFVHHFGSRTFSGAQIDMEKSLHRNWAIFKKKWSIPEDLDYGGNYNLTSIVSQAFHPELHRVELPKVHPSHLHVGFEKELGMMSSKNATTGLLPSELGPQQAIEILFKYLPTIQKDALVMNDIGVFLSLAGNTVAALDCYRKAHELSPRNPNIAKNLADLLFVGYGDLYNAMAIYLKVLESNVEDCDCLLAIGHISAAIGLSEEAIDFYNRVRQIEPGHINANEAYQHIVTTAGPDANFEKPGVDEEYEGLLDVNLGHRLIPVLESFSKKHPDYSRVFNDLGTLFAKNKEHSRSKSYYQRAIELEPHNTIFLKNLADHFLIIDGALTEATAIYTKVLELDPDDIEALTALAKISHAIGDDAGASIFMESIKRISPVTRSSGFNRQTATQDTNASIGFITSVVNHAVEADSMTNCEKMNQARSMIGDAPERSSGNGVTLYLIASKNLSLTYQRLIELSEEGEHSRLCMVWSNELGLLDPSALKRINTYIDEDGLLCEDREKIVNKMSEDFMSDPNPYIAIIWDDIWVADGWLKRMVEHLRSASNVAAVGPMGNFAVGRQNIDIDTEISPLAFAEKSNTLACLHRHKRISCSTLNEYCVAMSKASISAIGSLDTELKQLNAAISDLCLRLKMAGYQNVISADTIAYKKNCTPKHNEKHIRLTKKWNKLIKSDAKWNRAVIELKLSEGVESEYYQKGLADALKLTSSKLKIDDMGELLLSTLVELCIDCGQFEVAKPYSEALMRSVKNCRAYSLSGIVEHGLGNEIKAKELAAKALENNSNDAEALNLMGEIEYATGDLRKALQHFELAINADKSFGDPIANMGTMMWDNEPENAFELYSKAFRLMPYRLDIIELFQSAADELNQYERALSLIEDAIVSYPEVRLLRYIEIDYLARSGQTENAMSKVISVLCDFPVDPGFIEPALKIRHELEAKRNSKDQNGKKLLSLCLIVKDEASNIARCLDSVAGLVDEIIVVDTGSEDDTVSIASIMGAKVIHHDWKDDFSEARNIYLKESSAEWILVLDADEVIAKKDHDKLRKIIQTENNDRCAYVITTRNYDINSSVIGWSANKNEYPEEEQGTGWIPTDKVRLFPNNSDIRYDYPVHEMLEPSLTKQGYKLIKIDVPVHHYGKLNIEKTEKKYENYYKLGVQKLEEDGNNPYSLRELAIQAGLLEKHEKAIQLWERLLEIKPDLPEAYVNMATAYYRLERFGKAFDHAELAYRSNPEYREGVYNYALMALHIGNMEIASSIGRLLLDKYPDYSPGLLLYSCVCLATENTKGAQKALNLLKKTPLWPVITESFDSFCEQLKKAGKEALCQKIMGHRSLWES